MLGEQLDILAAKQLNSFSKKLVETKWELKGGRILDWHWPGGQKNNMSAVSIFINFGGNLLGKLWSAYLIILNMTEWALQPCGHFEARSGQLIPDLTTKHVYY